MATHHTADEFSTTEWTAFWRENGKQVTNYTSIFKATIRANPWRDYAAHIADRLAERAPKGTLKVHTFDMAEANRGCIGAISYEPKPEPLSVEPEVAMLKAIEMFAPRTDYVSLP